MILCSPNGQMRQTLLAGGGDKAGKTGRRVRGVRNRRGRCTQCTLFLPDQRISLGSVYALIALGYTMVHGIAKMLNFAHGDVIMIGVMSFFAFGASGLTRCCPSSCPRSYARFWAW